MPSRRWAMARRRCAMSRKACPSSQHSCRPVGAAHSQLFQPGVSGRPADSTPWMTSMSYKALLQALHQPLIDRFRILLSFDMYVRSLAWSEAGTVCFSLPSACTDAVACHRSRTCAADRGGSCAACRCCRGRSCPGAASVMTLIEVSITRIVTHPGGHCAARWCCRGGSCPGAA